MGLALEIADQLVRCRLDSAKERAVGRRGYSGRLRCGLARPFGAQLIIAAGIGVDVDAGLAGKDDAGDRMRQRAVFAVGVLPAPGLLPDLGWPVGRLAV